MATRSIPSVSILDFFFNAKLILRNPLPFHRKNFEQLGDTFQIKVSLTDAVVISRNPELAQYALQKNHRNFSKSPIQTEEVAKYVGHGLLTIEGEHWKKQRRLIQPAFHKENIIQLLDTVQHAINVELDKLKTNTPLDVFPIFNDLAFQTVVKSLFSSAAGQEDISRLQYITEATQRMVVRELRQFYKKWWFYMSGSIKYHKNLTQEARDILRNLVEERRASGKRENDLLDLLLEARYDDGSPMKEQQLLDEILILFTAGHETTSNALTFISELLARHPEVQERIYAEVSEARKETTNPFEFLQRCAYTTNVIEEAMRLYPPAYFIDRVNITDDEFQGMKIPKGSSLLFSMYEIHRHKDHWQDPEAFIPERFSRERTQHYYPFGAGPRKCIGNNFAMYEMILAVAELMSRFRVEPKTGPIEVDPLITLKPKNAILKFVPRKGE